MKPAQIISKDDIELVSTGVSMQKRKRLPRRQSYSPKTYLHIEREQVRVADHGSAEVELQSSVEHDDTKEMIFSITFEEEQIGFTFQKDCLGLEEGAYVNHVQIVGPASKTQLLPGDKVMRLNKEDVSDLEPSSVASLIYSMPRPITIEFCRNTEEDGNFHLMAKHMHEQELLEQQVADPNRKTSGHRMVYLARRESLRAKQRENYFKKRSKCMIHPENPYKQAWDVLILVLVLINVIYIPLTLGFANDIEENPYMSTMTDLLFVADIVITFRCGYFTSNGLLVMRATIVRSNYMSSSTFYIDVISSFPFELFSALFQFAKENKSPIAQQQTKILLRVLKLPRLLRVSRLIIYLNRSKYKSIFKIVRLFFVLFLAAHWIGCIFFWLCQMQTPEFSLGDSTTSWCSNPEHDLRRRTWGGRYVMALFTSFTMLSAGDVLPTSTPERIFVTCSIVIGQVVSGIVIGNISLILTNQQSEAALYQQKIDMATDAMTTMNLPMTIQKRVIRYYDILWSRHRTLDSNRRFTADLNPSLKTDISLFLSRDLIANNPLFTNCHDGMILSLVEKFHQNVYLKGCHLAREGEIGNCMYFLEDGNVIGSHNGDVLMSYESGSYFGEISLLIPNETRFCDLIALSDTDVRELHRCDFEMICYDHPTLKRLLIENVRKQGYADPQLLKRCEYYTSALDLPDEIRKMDLKLDSLQAQMNILTRHVLRGGNNAGQKNSNDSKKQVDNRSSVSGVSNINDINSTLEPTDLSEDDFFAQLEANENIPPEPSIDEECSEGNERCEGNERDEPPSQNHAGEVSSTAK